MEGETLLLSWEADSVQVLRKISLLTIVTIVTTIIIVITTKIIIIIITIRPTQERIPLNIIIV